MTWDLALWLAGVACLSTIAAVAAWSLYATAWLQRHRILAALRGETAALGGHAPRATAGNPLRLVRADAELTSGEVR